MNRITITEHTETRWRDYAEYVIYKRGIPSFYDGLTNVQRVILANTPVKSTKSISVVGSAIKAGYSHGNSSLESALNGMAKYYNCAMPLLEGDGFFGTPISDDAAAARYTSVSIKPEVKQIIDEHKNLNSNDIDGMPRSFHVDLPVGCFQNNTGIAVGFKSTILPRRQEDIEKYLKGEIDIVQPYFNDFGGSVEPADDSGSSWYIQGNFKTYTRGKKTHQLIINEIPITDKYETFIKKINKFLEKKDISSVRFINNSQNKVNITLETRSKKDFQILKNKIKSLLKSKKSENVGFIRDGKLLQYDKFEHYLDDFQVWLEELNLKQLKYDVSELNFDLEYLEWKKDFIQYIQSGKKKLSQINDFLSDANNKIRTKIKRLPAYLINNDELKQVINSIKEVKSEISDYNKKIKKQSDIVSEIVSSHESKANQIETIN